MTQPSGWFDDVAFAAAFGPTPLLVAVCANLQQSKELLEWLLSAIPSVASMVVREIPAEDVPAKLPDNNEQSVVWVIPDAAEGADDGLEARWQRWNRAREVLRMKLSQENGPRQALVFLATVPRMPLISVSAPDLISVAETMTVEDEPFSVPREDAALVATYQRVVVELEKHYGLSTEELQDRLFDRTPLPSGLTQPDLSRWKAAAEVLRKL
jgi:hypothetical protein